MATPQSSLIIKQYEGFGGNFLDSDYLAAAYESGKPHILEGALMKIYSSQSRFFNIKPFMNMTSNKSGGPVEIPTEMFQWTLQGAEYKAARVVENVDSANTTPGLNNGTFRVKLDLDYFHYPDVLFSEDNDLPLQIVEAPIPDGTGTIYTLRIQTDNPAVYLDPKNLYQGREFCKVWTSTPSEYNQWYGTQQVPNIFKLESQLGFFAQSITVTDKAYRDQGRLGVEFLYTDYNGTTSKVNKFLAMYEAKMLDELYRSMEVQLVYGKKSTTAGPGGYWQKTGPGIREQLKDSWVQYYGGALSVTLLQDYLMSVFFGREAEANRSVTAMTGTMGSILFHNALAAVANGFLTVDSHYIRSVPSPIETPYLAYGAQFTRYTGPQGIVVDLVLNPMYDDIMYCRRFHPQYPDMPIDSARMTFLDFGSAEGKNNISMLKVKDSFLYGWTEGTMSPMGPITNGRFGSLKNGYDVACQGSAGAVIRDVTRCGELIMDFEG